VSIFVASKNAFAAATSRCSPSFQEPNFISAVEAAPLKSQTMKWLLPDKPRHPIRKLHLITGAPLHAGEICDHLWH
jgi:hypothetical protein